MNRPTTRKSPSVLSPKAALLTFASLLLVGSLPHGALAAPEVVQTARCDIERVSPQGALPAYARVSFAPLAGPSASSAESPEFRIDLLDSQGHTKKSYFGLGELSGKSAQVTTYAFSRSGSTSSFARGEKNGRFFLEYGRTGWFTIREKGEPRLDIEFAGCTWSQRS